MKNILSLVLILLLINSCQRNHYNNITAVANAIIIDGNGQKPIDNGVLLIKDGRILEVGNEKAVEIPKNAMIIDASGKTIIPGLINAHAHVGYRNQVDADHYSSAQIQNQLELYARFGITTVASLGSDRAEARAFQAKNDKTEAIGRARLYIAGNIITANTKEGAIEMVDENAKNGTDFIKIRVDNNRGNSQAMTAEIYTTIIEQSHKNNLLLTAHMYDLQIAKDLLDAGADFLAHSVRDQNVDLAFLTSLSAKDVCYCPTLTRDLSTYVYGDTAAFFSDPFFIKYANTQEVEALLDPQIQSRTRNGNSYNLNKEALKMGLLNLKNISDSGGVIAMGTDSGMPNRFQGYFEHLEMEMMAEAGMSPMKIILSATRDAAKCLRLKDVGTLEKGMLADFVILDSNPLQNIKNTKSISSVWVGGKQIVR